MTLENSPVLPIRNHRSGSRRIAMACWLATAGIVFAPRATAVEVSASYNIDKTFTLNAGATTRIEKIAHFGTANTSATGGTPGSDINPPGGKPVAPGATSTIFAFTLGTDADAVAVSKATVDNFGAGDPVTGTVHVDGTTVTNDPRAGAHADSSSQIKLSGSFTTAGGVTTSVSKATPLLSSTGLTGVVKLKDPMSFEVFDLNTDELLLKDILFDFKMELYGPGSVIWGPDGLIVDAQNFIFNYDLTSPFLTTHGLIDFAVTGGVVTTSTATGILAGLLPGVGSTGIFNIALGGERTLEYDLGDFGGRAVDVSFNSDASGSADIVPVPEPGTLVAGVILGGYCAAQLWRRRRRTKAAA